MTQILVTNLIVAATGYVAVLAATLTDLISGICRSRREGMTVTSRRLRDTVRKLASYYFMLFALSGVDVMLVAAALGLRLCGGEGYVAFPYLTVLGAVGECMIEARSVMENSDRRPDLRETLRMLTALLRKVGV